MSARASATSSAASGCIGAVGSRTVSPLPPSPAIQLRNSKNWVARTTVYGEPGLVFRSGGRVVSVLSLRVEGGVRAVYITVNPDKLGRWAAAEVE